MTFPILGFDICLGWKGLLIESNSLTYAQAVVNCPQAHKMKFAPSSKEDGTIEFYKYPMTPMAQEGKSNTYDEKPTVSFTCGPLGSVWEDIFKGETIN